MSKMLEAIREKMEKHTYKPGTFMLYGPSGIPLPAAQIRYESLYKAQSFNNDPANKAKYSIQLLIPKKMTEGVKAHWDLLCEISKRVHKEKKYPKTEKIGWEFFKDGDLKAEDLQEKEKEFESYQGKWVVSASCNADKKDWKTGVVQPYSPRLLGKDGAPLVDTKIVAGMIVVAYVQFNASKQGINLSFDTVKFQADLGKRFAAVNGTIEVSDEEVEYDPAEFGVEETQVEDSALVDSFR
jgi:hypothetical protein